MVLTNGGISEEERLCGCVEVDVDVIRIGICEKIRCCVAVAIAVEQGAPYLCADQVLIRLAVVGRHARFQQCVPCGALPKLSTQQGIRNCYLKQSLSYMVAAN